MAIYLLLFLTIPILSMLTKDRKVLVIIICAEMWILAALRSETLGVDVDLYKIMYNFWTQYSFREMILSTRFIIGHKVGFPQESGFVWFAWLCAKAGLSFHSFLVVHSTICIAALGRFMYKYAEDSSLSLAIVLSFGLLGTFFCILRQALALVVLMFSVEPIKKRQFFRFMVVNCAAVLFHRAALIFLPVYFIYKIRITKRTLFVSVCALMAWLAVIPLLYPIVGRLLRMLGKMHYNLSSFTMNNMIILFIVLFVLLLFLVRNYDFYEKPEHRLSTWVFILAIATETVSLYVPAISRIAISLLFPFATIAIGDGIAEQKLLLNKRILRLSYYVVFLLFFALTLSQSGYSPYIPFWK